jgi:hypothetical protein
MNVLDNRRALAWNSVLLGLTWLCVRVIKTYDTIATDLFSASYTGYHRPDLTPWKVGLVVQIALTILFAAGLWKKKLSPTVKVAFVFQLGYLSAILLALVGTILHLPGTIISGPK